MNRSASARSRSSRLSQPGTQGGRGVSTVPSGTTPMASWRAKVSSRQRVPALGEAAPVPLDPLGRRVVGRMARAGGEVQEEGQLVVDGAEVTQVLDGAVGQVGAQVVALLDGCGAAGRVVVVVQRGNELVRLAAVEAVPAVEPSAERPRGRASAPCWSPPRGSGATCRRRRWRSRWPGGPRRGSRSPVAGGPSSPGNRWPGRPRVPCRCGGGCGRSGGRRGWASTARSCGSWPDGRLRRPGGRWRACRCRTRSSRAARNRRRRAR